MNLGNLGSPPRGGDLAEAREKLPASCTRKLMRVNRFGLQLPEANRGNAGFTLGAYGLRNHRQQGRRDRRRVMASLAGSLGRLWGPAGRSTASLRDRWLQSRSWLGLPDAWGLSTPQPARGKARGNEYQPSNIKRKHKHGWIKRLSTPAGVQVILRRMLKGRKSLSH
ncbi:large ribosomal subunit protein bL34m [Rhynchocyon petersi]